MRSIKDAIVYGLRKANYKDVRSDQQQVIEALLPAFATFRGPWFFIGQKTNTPVNVKPAEMGGEGGGRAWGGDLTFFKNLQSNSLPTGKSFQSNATKFPHPGLHIALSNIPRLDPRKTQ